MSCVHTAAWADVSFANGWPVGEVMRPDSLATIISTSTFLMPPVHGPASFVAQGNVIHRRRTSSYDTRFLFARLLATKRDSIASPASSTNTHPGSSEWNDVHVAKAMDSVRVYSALQAQSFCRCTCSPRHCIRSVRARLPLTGPPARPSQYKVLTSMPILKRAGK